MTPEGLIEVWIVDILGRLPASLPLELAKRKVAARLIRVAADVLDALKAEQPPAGVLFADVDSPSANTVAGYLAGLAGGRTGDFSRNIARAMVTWTWRTGPKPTHWTQRTRALPFSSGPSLAKVIAFQARKNRSRRLNAASAPPP